MTNEKDKKTKFKDKMVKDWKFKRNPFVNDPWINSDILILEKSEEEKSKEKAFLKTDVPDELMLRLGKQCSSTDLTLFAKTFFNSGVNYVKE